MESLEHILKNDDPVKVFDHLKRSSLHRTDKIKMMDDLIKVWEFFAMEKREGRLHYTPSYPGDTKGLTRKIEVHGTKKGYSIQFNARWLEHTFSIDFKESDIPMKQVVNYLNNTLKINKLVHFKGKSQGFEM